MSQITLQFTVTLEPIALKALAEALQLTKRPVVDPVPAKDSRTDASRRSLFGGALPEDEARLLDGKAAGAVLGVSAKTLERMAAAGQAPKAIKLGRAKRWDAEALRKWIDAGCPRVEG